MSFVKTSKSQRLAHIELSDGTPQITKTAAASIPSFYAQPGTVGTLDIKAALDKVAEAYDISANPSDYIFEAVRAVTAGVPNENGDAFHKNELLRFDHRLGCKVYQTFILKPHHVNHKADNPKTARGVILDAHYNEDSAALPSCPSCNAKTAERQDRDDLTGLYCRKCGSTVKDEFVEILIAIDRNKDPSFAEGVRTGVLNATSMGCVCDSTTCNVCNHIAYSKAEFCNHIRGGNKKKTFKTASGDKQAFEWCNNVIFTEDSRVDQPADPKALQREVFSLAAQRDAEAAKPDALRNESEMLLLSKRIAELEARIAQLQAPQPQQQQPQQVEQPAAEPVKPHSIDQYVHDQEEVTPDPLSLNEMGVRTEPGSGGLNVMENLAARAADDLDDILFAPTNSQKGNVHMANFKFRSAYKDLQAQITEQGNVRIASPGGTLFVVEAAEPMESDAAREFGAEVLRHVAEYGLVRTMNAFGAVPSPKIASILDKGIYDFADGRKDGEKPIKDGGDDDFKDKREQPEKKINADGEVDRASKPPPHDEKDSTLADGEVDHAEGRSKGSDSTVKDNEAPQKSKPSKKTVSDDTLSDGVVDHKDKKPGKTAQAKTAGEDGPPSKSKQDDASKPSASKSKPASKPSASKSKPSASKPAASKPPEKKSDDLDSEVDNAFDSATSAPEGGSIQEAAQMWVALRELVGSVPAPEAKQIVAQIDDKLFKLMASGADVPMADALLALMQKLEPAVASAGQPGGELAGGDAVSILAQIADTLGQMSAAPAAPAAAPEAAPAAPPAAPAQEPAMPIAAAKDSKGKWVKPWENKSKKSGSKPSKAASKSKKSKLSKSASKTSKAACGSKCAGCDKCAGKTAQKHETRIERLYKARIATLKQERDAAVAKQAGVVGEKFKRALKLAATRQRLNLEESPIKVAFADVLLSPMDLPGDEYYPGMDLDLTQTIIERAAADGFDSFVSRLVERAAEFMKMSDEAFAAVEADVDNLQPVMPVTASAEPKRASNQKRAAARQGNMHLAPSATVEAPARGGHDRSAVAGALSNTKIRRTSAVLGRKPEDY